MTNSTTIGQVELTAFPELTEHTVNARIDTGAKTSAIWVSSASQANGSLKVVFFDKSSPLYSGQINSFTDYAETIVSSSNGIPQKRYKVKLLVVLGGRRMRAWFTLADRSKQVYPVLIGRNLLKGKYVVDVSMQTNNLHIEEKKHSKVLRQQLKEPQS